MPTAVVYYSATGNCAIAAKALAGKLGAALIELKERKHRDFSRVNAAFMFAGMRAMLGFGARLEGRPWQEASSADEVHILFPIWASKPAPTVNTFLRRFNFAGKRVVLYSLQADPNDTARPNREKLADKIKARGGSVTATHYLLGSAPGKEPRAELAEEILRLR